MRFDYTTPRGDARWSTTDVGPARQNLLDVTGRDERDVAPHRALERADGRADVHRLLELALLEHGPEESGDVGVAGADRIDHLDRRHVPRTVETGPVDYRRARLPQLEAHRRLGRQPRQRLERLLGRAGEVEDRPRLRLAEEEVADVRQHRVQEPSRVGRRPEARAVVDVER